METKISISGNKRAVHPRSLPGCKCESDRRGESDTDVVHVVVHVNNRSTGRLVAVNPS